MNTMKTTVTKCKTIPGKADQKYDTCVRSMGCSHEILDVLCGPKSPASGRSVRQIINPDGAMKHVTRAKRRDALRRLIKATKRWHKVHHSGVRCVAFSSSSGMEQQLNDAAAADAKNCKTGGNV